MASPLSALLPRSNPARSVIEGIMGAAGTRFALNALRRYPKTSLALGVLAGASALLGGIAKAHSDAAEKPARKPRRKTPVATKAKRAAA